MNTLRQIHTFKIDTLTPVSVGSGATISPYSDFFLRNGKAYYVNQKKVEKRLEKEPHLIDEYVKQIRNGMNNNSSDFDLHDFLEEDLNIDTSTFTNVKVFGYDFRDDAANKKHEVNQLIREAGKPYLPGSTLKGAIRTAMLYDWLVNTAQGQKELHILCEEVLRFTKLRNYADWAAYRNDEINRKHPDWYKYKKLDDELRENLKDLKRKVLNENKLFGATIRKELKKEDKNETSKKEYSQLFSSDFIVRDSRPFEPDDIAIYAAARIRRFDLKNNSDEGEIPLACEAILPQKATTFDFLVNKKQTFAGSHLSYLAQNDSSIVLKQLSHFTKAIIDFEILSCKQAKTIGFEREIKKLLEFYINLQERSNNNEYFLRIGASKTFLNNVLVLALLNYKTEKFDVKEIYQHYAVIFGVKSKYPITRTVTKTDFLPFGWVKISSK